MWWMFCNFFVLRAFCAMLRRIGDKDYYVCYLLVEFTESVIVSIVLLFCSKTERVENRSG